MCAICALFAPSLDTHRLEKFMDCFWKLKHRGPHAFRVEQLGKTGVLGHHRLEVGTHLNEEIMQPLHYKNKYRLICNGDIYNWRDLEAYDAQTIKCDAQVIFPLYEKYQDNLVEFAASLDGVFAFCLVDLERKRIVLCRDVKGVRPLHTLTGPFGFLAVSSEAQALQPLQVKGENLKLHEFIPGSVEEFALQSNGGAIHVNSQYYDSRVSQIISEIITKEVTSLDILIEMRNAVGKMTKLEAKKMACLVNETASTWLLAAILSQIHNDAFKVYYFGDDIHYSHATQNYSKILCTENWEVLDVESLLAKNKASLLSQMREMMLQTHASEYTKMVEVTKYISEANPDVAILFYGCHDSTRLELQELDYTSSAHGLEFRLPFMDVCIFQMIKRKTEPKYGNTMSTEELFTELLENFEAKHDDSDCGALPAANTLHDQSAYTTD